MLRGCLLALAFYVALAVAYYFWLATVFEPPGSYIGAGVVGLIVFFALGSLLGSRRAYSDWSLLAAFQRGQPPRDGRLVAVAGEIHPVGQPLIAPFSGEQCVLCEYDMSRQRRGVHSSDEENTGSDFAGFLMVPSAVRSALGEMRILGFPMFEGFGERPCNTYDCARRAIDYLTTHEFESRTGVKMVTVLGVFEDVWSDEDGLVEKNIRLGTVSLPDLFPPELEAEIDRQVAMAAAAPKDAAGPGDEEVEDEEEDEDDFEDEDEGEDDGNIGGHSRPDIPRMTEKRVPVGAEVCAIGIYNEMRRGLLPSARGRQPNRLFLGTAESQIAKFRGNVFSYLIGGLVALVLVHAATYGVMLAYLHSSQLADQRKQAAFEAVQKEDLAALTRLIRRGMDVNIRDSQGQTPLISSRNPAVTAWLIEHGADVNAADNSGVTALMRAAQDGQAETVKQLIAAKANVNARRSDYDRTALMEAVDRGDDEIAGLLRQAGAKDDVITGVSGQPLPDDGGEPLAVCKEYLAAIHARDPATLTRLFSPNSKYDFAGVDWELWHNTRPAEISRWTGFVNGDDATITVQGTSGRGIPTTWVYQLQRMEGQWKITRERERS